MKDSTYSIGIVLCLIGIALVTWRLRQPEEHLPTLYKGEDIVLSASPYVSSSSSLYSYSYNLWSSSTSGSSSSELSVSGNSPEWGAVTIIKTHRSSSSMQSLKSSSPSLQSSSSSLQSQTIHRRRSDLNCGNSTLCSTSSSQSSHE